MQKKKTIAIIVLLLSLTCGAWIAGRATAPREEEERVPEQSADEVDTIESIPTPTQTVEVVQSVDDTEELAELRRSLADALNVQSNLVSERDALLRDYTVVDAELAKIKAEEAEKAKREEERRERRNNGFEGYMERLKEENPERYAEMQKSRQEMRTRMQRQTAERAAFLLDVDTARMTPEQLENHEKLVDAVAEAFQMMDALNNGEEANVSRRDMFHRMHAISELYDTERDYLLEQTARDLGFGDDDVDVFADHIKRVYEMTSTRGIFRSGHSRGSRGDRARASENNSENTSQ